MNEQTIKKCHPENELAIVYPGETLEYSENEYIVGKSTVKRKLFDSPAEEKTVTEPSSAKIEKKEISHDAGSQTIE